MAVLMIACTVSITTHVEAASAKWYAEWTYTLDSSAQTIAPKQYNGSATTYTLPSSATINGVKYTTLLGAPNNNGPTNILQTGSIQNLSFSAGIKITGYLSYLFYNDTNLVHIDLTNFNTNNLWDMRNMFSGCTNLQSINFSGFDTSTCSGFQAVFKGCKNLKTLDLSGFDFTRATSFSMLFDGCESLTYVDTSSFGSAKKYCPTLEYMFRNCASLTSLDLSTLNPNYILDMRQMFQGCSNLATLNISSFNTAKVSAKVDGVSGIDSIFKGCNKLKHLTLGPNTDFSNFSVTDASFPVIPTSTGSYTGKWAYNTATNHSNTLSSLTTYNGSNPGLWTWETQENTNHVVYLEGNGGTFDGGVSSYFKGSLQQGDTYGYLPTPTYEGYDFAGWYTSATGGYYVGYDLSSKTMGTSDVTYYAHWTKKAEETQKYTVTYVANGGYVYGSTTYSKTVTKGSTLGELPEPTRSGYTFVSWTEENGLTVSSSLPINRNITLTAQWKQNQVSSMCDVTFNANGGNVVLFLNRGETYTTQIQAGTAIGSDFDSIKASWSGHTFDGWYTAKTGGEKFTSSTVVSCSITLYAHWDGQDTATYTITFDANGGTVNGGKTYSKTVDAGSTIGSMPAPDRKGFTFVAWVDASGRALPSETVVNQDITLFAKWEENQATTMCDVTFNANGGNVKLFLSNKGETYNVSIKSGTAIGSDFNSINAVWSGHTFDGWYTAKTGGEKFTGDTVVSSSITLYAHWDGQDSVKTYTVTYDANGGTVNGEKTYSTTVNGGDKLGTLPTPVQNGYSFVSWKDERGTVVSADTVVTSDMTLTAQWQKRNVAGICDVTFDGNGGDVVAFINRGSTYTIQINAGSSIGSDFDSVKATWDGHTFDGWYTEAKGGTKFTRTDVIKGPIVLYAHWDGQDTKTIDLQVTLTVSGNLGSRDKEFSFTTQFPSSLYGKTLTVEKSDGSTSEIDIDASGVASFTLKHGESIKFKKLTEEQANAIKALSDFGIKENSYKSDGYTTEYTASADDSGNLAVVYRNTRKSAVPTGNHIGTGITVTVLIGIAGLALMLRKKRK